MNDQSLRLGLVVQQHFIRSPRRLLQLDLVGALMTSATMGLLFATKLIDCGLPIWILLSMTGFAFCFACFDAVGVFWATDPRPFLLTIAILNLAYCVFSIVICFLYFEQLTWIGEIYFSVEVAVIVLIALWECFVFSSTSAKNQLNETLEEISAS
jgi:hypothetical protein